MSGEIHSGNIVSIGADGIFCGELKAKKLIVSGDFKGDAECDSIELLKGGKINGKIVSEDLMIESGSFFEGESQLKSKKKEETKEDSAS